MPNWMTTRCKISGTPEQMQELRKFAFRGEPESDTQTIDFNKIVPMPPAILESIKNNESLENYPDKHAAFFLLVLNHGDMLPHELFFELRLQTSSFSTWPERQSDLVTSRQEVIDFLDAINLETGISTKQLSREALIRAFRATTTSLLGGDAIAKMEKWCKNKLLRHGVVYSEVALDGLSLTDLVILWKKIPGFSSDVKSGVLQLRVLAETGYPSWYEWSIANWGTKWDVDEINIIYEDKGRLDFTFDTAWSFPEPIFHTLAAKFPEMEIWCASIEEGNIICGCGHFTPVRNGEAGEEFSFCAEEEMDYVYSLIYDEERPQYDGDSDTEETSEEGLGET